MIQRFAPQKTEIVKIKATWNPRILPGESAPQIRRYCPGSTQQDKATRYEATYRARRQATIQRLLPREKEKQAGCISQSAPAGSSVLGRCLRRASADIEKLGGLP